MEVEGTVKETMLDNANNYADKYFLKSETNLDHSNTVIV
jgi:hypothetical protein